MSVFSVAVTLLLAVLAKVSITITIAHTWGMNKPLPLNIKHCCITCAGFGGPRLDGLIGTNLFIA